MSLKEKMEDLLEGDDFEFDGEPFVIMDGKPVSLAWVNASEEANYVLEGRFSPSRTENDEMIVEDQVNRLRENTGFNSLQATLYNLRDRVISYFR